ncbi:hypothetical protein WA026_012153 [Henosepilachna vigintioctopunctata]|uniref:NudC domain-containing protein 1 n=1 Tax=Henosepilachna vigintioctopunctata TaxID=420089 RepID=A0AAW1V6B3_9CUCU
MCTNILELKPERNFLDPNFDGYKLSLRSAITEKYLLDSPIKRTLINSDQYSLLHAKIFGMNNFLTGESETDFENVYFVDNERNLKKGSLNDNKKLMICNIWNVPKSNAQKDSSDSDCYNFSLKLISNNLAVLANGEGSFFILDTGNRKNHDKWKLLYQEELWDGKEFYIQDAVLNECTLHVILCRIEQNDKKSSLLVNIVKLTNLNSWEKISFKQLLVQGDVSYLYLDRTCDAVYVASTLGCLFTFDSENPVVDDLAASVSKNVTEKCYKWDQDENDVVIHFIMPQDIKKDCVDVTTSNTIIKVEFSGISLIDGVLFNTVESDLTTVNITKNLIEISLVKKDQGLTWPDLLKDTSSSESFIRSEVKEEPNFSGEKELLKEDTQQGLTFNTEEIEECDFTNDEYTIFERVCLKTHQVTHKYNFGSNQVLLTVQRNKNMPPCIGVRHDVDICIWEPQFENSNFQLKNVATLLAMGYIQASKQQKKFISCPKDTSYSLICETSRHLFIYQQQNRICTEELRNRRSGSRINSIAEQLVVSIPNDEIFGIYSSPNAIYILGEKFLMYISI